MKLLKAEIKNFRSIHHTNLSVDNNVTTLVGTNEHGKSNLLKALKCVNPNTTLELSDDLRIT